MRTLVITEEDIKGTIYEQHFDELITLSQKKNKNLEQLLTIICARYDVDINDVLSRSKKRNIVIARTAFMFIGREIDLINNVRYKHSLDFVGSIVNRDHSTVLSAIKRIKKDCTSKNFKYDLEDLIKNLFGDAGIKRFNFIINKK